MSFVPCPSRTFEIIPEMSTSMFLFFNMTRTSLQITLFIEKSVENVFKYDTAGFKLGLCLFQSGQL